MSPTHPLSRHSTLLLAWLFLLATLLHTASASECSGTTLCPSGCCSKYGFCGFSSEHCGAGCLSTCDAVPPETTAPGGGGECSADISCKVGCCSKYGNCGFGEEYCSTEQGCVNNCGLKSECDAGWGLEWAESKTCPLNVCCSKFGFCGTTEKFCGEDDEFDRPSCDVDGHRIERVIGYYEQWSLERPCNRVSPEAIPAGYYTHINFAFAGIDPETFEIRGSAGGDDALWKRIQSLRLEQPSVEIWIALGGWVFNDPDQPTRTTFSDIARSEENQKAFAKSLLSMMSKYGFDGVDIDWEYPVAEERSGREEDYKNFPKWMKNLRSQLHSSGKKYGLSLTLPASYWYLQHFDIKKLEESVNWLNVMTYDMHGTWDMNNTWVGPYLNPHTNLTEIKNSMDLLWRNDIDPSKVVMGMAYYGRSFTLADPGCTEPGCTYRSGGNAGECSETVGFLLNSEIQDTINSLGLTPTLYEEDAVKAVAFGDQWVSYDDEETFRIRGDYARSQCMGGVMVWAISHDDRNHTSAKALTSGVGRKRMDFPNYPETPSSSSLSSVEKRQETKALGGPTCSGLTCGEKYQEEVVDACRWTNCGDDCPTGWKWIDREGSDLKMTDETACGGAGNRKFCCPGDSELPKCRWRGMPSHGGICSPGCNDGEVEVGTLAKYCDFSHQSACCTTTKSTEPYGQCKWVGGSPTCASSGKHASCPSDYPTFLFSSSAGAGGEQICTQGSKSFCCKGEIPWQFQKCDWHQKATNRVDASWYCESSCPDGQTKLGMHHGDCAFGWEAYCCAGDPPAIKDDNGATVERRDPDQQNYYGYMEDPGAPEGYRSPNWGLARRAAEFVKRSVLSVESFDRLNTLTARTVVSLLSMTVNLWNRRGPATEFGRSYLAQEMNEMVFGAAGEADAFGYVSDMNAFPELGHNGTLRLRAAEADLCELVGGGAAKAKRALQTSNLQGLEERHVNVFGGLDNVVLIGEPAIEDILRGILDGFLTLHYARWEHYGNVQRDGSQGASAGPFLELAYWIGTRIGERGFNAGLYQDDTSDRWVVFHLHTLSDEHAFIPDPNQANNPFMGVTHITVYHGQRLQTAAERNGRRDLRVYNEDRRRHADGTYAGNTRADAFECDDGERWWPGNVADVTPEGHHTYAALLQAWGRSLHTQGYLGTQGYQVLFNYNGNRTPDPARYSRYGRGLGRNFIVERRVVNGREQMRANFRGDATL
ncbi:hypothetical protein BDW60DRAFT_206795 [Aspergillus nidulans var. acristatus]